MRYAYVAVNAAGRRLRGLEEGANTAMVSRSLESRGLVVLTVEEARGRVGSGSGRAFARFGRRRDVLEATRALAALLTSGLPLVRALTTATVVLTGHVADVLSLVRERVERGEPLANALSLFPECFTTVYVGVVRAGERSGDLGGAFVALADQLEREERLRSRLLSASLYPLVLAAAGGIAAVVLLLLVLPRFAEILSDNGVPLPRSTALMLSLGDAAHAHWLLLLTSFLLLAVSAVATQRYESGRRAMARCLLWLPIVGSLRRHVLAARFARLTGVLLAGGAPILSAIDDACMALDDPLARVEVQRIRARTREGVSLRQAIGEGTLFPSLFGQLIAVGEETGRLQEFFLRSASILEERMDRLLQRLVSLAEPVMIVLFGGVVGFVALSLLQAIYGVNADALR